MIKFFTQLSLSKKYALVELHRAGLKHTEIARQFRIEVLTVMCGFQYHRSMGTCDRKRGTRMRKPKLAMEEDSILQQQLSLVGHYKTAKKLCKEC